MNTFIKQRKLPLMILVLLLSFNFCLQHAKCSRVLKDDFLDHELNTVRIIDPISSTRQGMENRKIKDNSNNNKMVMHKWIQQKAKVLLEAMNTASSSSPSTPNPTCHLPVC